MRPKVADRDHHRHDGEPVEAVGEVHRIAGADHDEARDEREGDAERNQHILEERHAEGGGERTRRHMHGERGGDERDARLDGKAQPAGEAFMRLLRHLEEVVVEADGRVAEGHAEHDPDEGVAQIGPEQGGDEEAREDHQPAHGGRAFLA